MSSLQNDFGGNYSGSIGPNGASNYQANGDQQNQLFQALLKQSMGQQQSNNPMAAMLPGLMALFGQAKDAYGTANANYSMGDDG